VPDFLTGQRLTADLLNDNIADLAVAFIGSESLTSDSSTWVGTESGAVHSITVPVIEGRTYRIDLTARISTDAQTFPITAANSEIAIIRIREDSSTGTQLCEDQVLVTHATGNGHKITTFAHYIADATEDKTFVMTGQRNGTGSSGNQRVRAATTKPTIFDVFQLAA